ncbi:MAG: branched-chain amino acid ABC transporter permease [Patescibacteria group bacterium]
MFGWQILLNSLVLGTQVLLLAVPLYLVYSVSRVYHLALGASGIFTAYALYFAISSAWPLGLAIIFSVLVAIILSFLSYRLLNSAIRKKETMPALLISLALGIILESLISIIFGTDAKSLVGGVLPIISLGGLHITVPGIITLSAGVFLALLFLVLMNKTPWGRKLASVAENDNLAASLGIEASAVRLGTFIVAGLLAGFVGIMITLNTALVPTAGFPLVIMAFIVLLIGGLSSLRGLIISAYVLTLIPEFMISLSGASWSLGASWKMLIVFILAALVLICRPNGLFINQTRGD